MKRQTSLFGEDPDPQGDGLANVYTPDSLALEFVRRLDGLYPTPPKAVLEAHVGGGAFVRAIRQVWPDTTVYASDADPNAAGLEYADVTFAVGADFVDVIPLLAGGLNKVELMLGNPPFDRRPDDPSPLSTAGPQFDVAAWHLPWMDIAWLLPVDLYSVQVWSRRMHARPTSDQWPVTRRIWPNVRGCAMWVWPGDASRVQSPIASMVPLDWDAPDRQRKGDARMSRVSNGQ